VKKEGKLQIPSSQPGCPLAQACLFPAAITISFFSGASV
jgi:hypothetical protein